MKKAPGSRRAWIDSSKTRLCMGCIAAKVRREDWGSWTWIFGVCMTCAHFGVTVEAEDVAGSVAASAIRAQGILPVDPPTPENWFDGEG